MFTFIATFSSDADGGNSQKEEEKDNETTCEDKENEDKTSEDKENEEEDVEDDGDDENQAEEAEGDDIEKEVCSTDIVQMSGLLMGKWEIFFFCFWYGNLCILVCTSDFRVWWINGCMVKSVWWSLVMPHLKRIKGSFFFKMANQKLQ